ncbi:MAG: S41 family peptidase [Caldilineaceae bacterium]
MTTEPIQTPEDRTAAADGALVQKPAAAQPADQGADRLPVQHEIAASDQHGAGQLRANRPLVVTCLSIALGVVLLLVGFGVGFGLGSASASASGSRSGAGAEHLYPKFGVFWEAMDLLYKDFYGELPATDEATYGAIQGVLSKLKDHNTSFMSPEEANYFRSNLEGSFEGIGARVDWDVQANTVRVVEPFENQPAWKAGVKRDDLIVAVDGESIIGTDLVSAIDKIRGPKGSKVVLTIVRQGEDAALDIEVTRDRIEIPTIATDTLDGDIAYIQLNTFNENAGDLVREAVTDALAKNPKGMIFDLRGNPGGLLTQAVAVANVFMEDSNVLIERFADGKEQVYKTENKATAKDIPLVVLVNEGSASASEIVAGAIQDNGRGKMVGAKTYGKGSVQLPQTLSDGSIMRVTIARWFTPKDRTIDGTGLDPDVVVPVTDQERQQGTDPQLNKAVELLGGNPEPLPVQ